MLQEFPVKIKTEEVSDCDNDGDWSGAENVTSPLIKNYNDDDDDEDGQSEEDDSDSYDEIENCEKDDNDFYIGQDKKTIWSKQCTKRRKLMKESCKISETNAVIDGHLLSNFDNIPGISWKNDDNGTFDELISFKEMFDDDMIQIILKHTNAYISRMKSSTTFGRERDCKLTSQEEILAIIGMLFLIGAKKGNHVNVSKLWTKDGTGMPVLRASMSAKRFLFLLRCIRFDDKDTREELIKKDNLAPIRELLDKFVNNCKTKHTVGEFITIGEKLEPFKGKCNFIHYMPNRSARYGLKILALCDSETYYTSNLEVHCGRQQKGNYSVSDEQYYTVLRLVDHLKGTNRNLTTSNRYTSFPLANSLLENKITLLGALRQNNKEILPLQFQGGKNRAVGSTMFAYLEDITVASHVPKKHKCLSLLSTFHNDEINEETKKPCIILDYYRTKGAVDTMDKLCNEYSVSRITRRWPLALFYAFLNIAGINAYVIYQSNINNPKYSRASFLENLALKLMRPLLEERAKLKNLPKDIQLFLNPYEIKPSMDHDAYEKYKQNPNSDEDEHTQPKNKRKRRRRCVICGRKKERSTNMICSKCGIYICKDHCNIVITCLKCEHENKTRVEDYDSE